MRIHRTVQGDVDVLACSGEFDGRGARTYAATVKPLIDECRTRFVLDFSGLRFLESKGLQRLIDTHNKILPMGGRQVIAAPTRIVKTVIKTTGVHCIVPIFPDVESARIYFEDPDAAQPDDLSEVDIEEALIGRIQLEFGLQGQRGRAGVAQVTGVSDEGLRFRYPVEGHPAPIDPTEMQVGQNVWLHIGRTVPAPDREMEIDGVLTLAFGEEGPVTYSVRYTHIDPADREIMSGFAAGHDQRRRFVNEETRSEE